MIEDILLSEKSFFINMQLPRTGMHWLEILKIEENFIYFDYAHVLVYFSDELVDLITLQILKQLSCLTGNYTAVPSVSKKKINLQWHRSY